MTAPHVVGILGGMGPAAGSDFSRLFVNACEAVLVARGEPVTDQAFPEHWLAQVPLPDRTEALLGEKETPLPGMLKALRQLSALGARSVAVACNTAHAWHEELQARCPDIELLHIVRGTTRQLALRHGVKTVVLACTEIPLALQSVPGYPEVRLVNPADTLAKALADRAYSQAGWLEKSPLVASTC